MKVFGESWLVSHTIAALCCAAAVSLTSAFVLRRFPVPAWRLPGAVLAAILVGLNVLVVRFGGLAQAYGLCLLAVVAAYWFTILAVERKHAMSAAIAGLLCGIAAGSSLLTAPVGPIMLLWMLVYNRSGRSWVKAAAFILGEALAFTPILWLWIQGHRQVLFGILNYNLLYRKIGWPNATQQNLEVVMSWIDSGHALILILLAAGGLLYIQFRSNWETSIKAPFYLCAWLSTTLAAYISNVRPTFERYYLLTVPFLGILAVAGVTAAASKLYRADRPWVPVLLLAFLVLFGLGKSLYDERDSTAWTDMEQLARKVNAVTTPDQTLFADEAIYFLTRHTPPSGMEMRDSHKFTFSRSESALLHVIPQAELDSMVKKGYFHTLETCGDDKDIEAHGYARVYAQSTKAVDCTVFWDYKPPR
jgi:4-amino-4-deoxy-L-arabinose transferase-like glycosyltransferase